MAKQWAIVIPFTSRAKAVYAAKCLKDYVALDKCVKEVELTEEDEMLDYLYIERVIG